MTENIAFTKNRRNHKKIYKTETQHTQHTDTQQQRHVIPSRRHG
jgi:hypothetical protein